MTVTKFQSLESRSVERILKVALEEVHETRSLILVRVKGDRFFFDWSSGSSRIEGLGAIEMLKHNFIAAVMEGEDDE